MKTAEGKNMVNIRDIPYIYNAVSNNAREDTHPQTIIVCI